MSARGIRLAAAIGLLALDAPAWAQVMQPMTLRPFVDLIAPLDGQQFVAGETVLLDAIGTPVNGEIDETSVLLDGMICATAHAEEVTATWTATAGTHTVAASTSDQAASRTSPTITITVVANQLPSVSLTSPGAGASYAAGESVPMRATASDADGSIARVEFLVDGSVVGQDATSPYAYDWPAANGDHDVSARAVDNRGGTKTTAATGISAAWEIPSGAVTRTYAYDSYEQLCRVVEPETGVTLMGYDGAGTLAWSASGLAESTDCSPDGNTAAILARKAVRTYDARNRIETLAFPDANGNQSWTYTPDGLPDTVTTFNVGGASSVVNSYLYDKRRLLVGETQSQTGNPDTWSIGYGYSVNGAPASVSYPTGLAVTYNPNALGQPTQVASATQTLASGITYFPNGALKQFTYGNGIVHTLTQNLRGLPAISRDANGSTAIHHDEYAYDQNGNVLAISDGVSGNRGDRDMTYDALDRLTDTTSPMYGATGTHYSYDTLDNVTGIAAPGRDGAWAQSYCYDQHQWLTNVKVDGDCDTGSSILGIGYDPQGNLANWNGVLYAFDYGNRLRSIAGIDAYRYDAWGRRVRQNNASGLIYSLYGRDGTLLWQRNERSGQRRNYVYLQGSLLAEDRLPLVGSTETVTYQHTDALGTPVATTNASKTVLQRSEYEPYGKLLNRPMEDGPDYTGHVSDAGSKLVYMQQRYYDPRTGRFWSTDPVTAYEQPIANFNRYRYANDNPYHYTDPDGRVGIDVAFVAYDLYLLATEGATTTNLVATGLDVASTFGLGFGAGQIYRGARMAEHAAEIYRGSKLAKNMAEAGNGVKKGVEEAHHIVAQGDRRAAEAREILNRNGVGVHDAENGARMPKSDHATVHTSKYHEEVTNRLQSAEQRGTGAATRAQELRCELECMRQELQSNGRLN
jgi:RHS repeat-associated protein